MKVYRTMQVIDGKLYSPMATKVGVVEQSEEYPEIIKHTRTQREVSNMGMWLSTRAKTRARSTFTFYVEKFRYFVIRFFVKLPPGWHRKFIAI